jgi:hypothetical protein
MGRGVVVATLFFGLVINDIMDMGMRSFNIGICYFRLFF